jgi:hypothetical protein
VIYWCISGRKEKKLFEQIFRKLHEKNKEILIVGVWGKDGLELEKRYFSDISGIDLELAGAELADIISKLDKLRIAPEGYFIRLYFHGYSLLIFSLTPDFFLVVVAEKMIIPGKLIFYLDLYKSTLISAL